MLDLNYGIGFVFSADFFGSCFLWGIIHFGFIPTLDSELP